MKERKNGNGEQPLYCSFCGKAQHEVKKMIAGPTVFICDECIKLCSDILKEDNGADGSAGQGAGNALPMNLVYLILYFYQVRLQTLGS